MAKDVKFVLPLPVIDEKETLSLEKLTERYEKLCQPGALAKTGQKIATAGKKVGEIVPQPIKNAGDAAKDMIMGIVKDPEVGEEYTGEVVGIKDFGAFVRLRPGKDGLLHISKMAKGRINRVEDVLNIGDEVKVVITDIDRGGKISLDRVDKPDAGGVSYEVVDDHDKNGGGYEGRAKRRR